jgi:hypothetical protein
MFEGRSKASTVLIESDYDPTAEDILLLDRFDCQSAIHRATGLDAYMDKGKREIVLCHPITSRTMGIVSLETGGAIPNNEQDRARLKLAYETVATMARIAKVQAEIGNLATRPMLNAGRIAVLKAYVAKLEAE